MGRRKTREHLSLHSLIHHKSHRDREAKLAAVEDVGWWAQGHTTIAVYCYGTLLLGYGSDGLSSSETGNKIYSFFIRYLLGIFPLRKCTKPTVVDLCTGRFD